MRMHATESELMRGPTQCQCNEAMLASYEAYYQSGDWIEYMKDHDAEQILRQVWGILMADKDYNGDRYSVSSKMAEIKMVMEKKAEFMSTICAEKDFPLYLGD